MATTNISGKRRRITERNSNPDICGIFRSETISSGTLVFSCKRASKPSSAVATSYPSTDSVVATIVRILGSSSTMSIRFLGESDIVLLATKNTTAPKPFHLEVGDGGSLSFGVFQCCANCTLQENSHSLESL